jgi:hypothetical protein
MFFFLSTPDYNKTQSNTTKVKVYLRNGIAEVLDQHQDLIGRVENNILEVESNIENKVEKSLYILQDAVFIVSTKGLDKKSEIKQTGVYVYARRVKEINQASFGEDFTKQYEQKNSELEKEITKLENVKDDDSKASSNIRLILNSRILLLKEDAEFLKRVGIILKSFKK